MMFPKLIRHFSAQKRQKQGGCALNNPSLDLNKAHVGWISEAPSDITMPINTLLLDGVPYPTYADKTQWSCQ